MDDHGDTDVDEWARKVRELVAHLVPIERRNDVDFVLIFYDRTNGSVPFKISSTLGSMPEVAGFLNMFGHVMVSATAGDRVDVRREAHP